MNAIAERVDQEEVAPPAGLADQFCPRHGLHFNPAVLESCGRCQEESRQARQARLALVIVGVVLLAIVTVMLQVTYLWWTLPADDQDSQSISRSRE